MAKWQLARQQKEQYTTVQFIVLDICPSYILQIHLFLFVCWKSFILWRHVNFVDTVVVVFIVVDDDDDDEDEDEDEGCWWKLVFHVNIAANVNVNVLRPPPPRSSDLQD